jgi:uncharacterized DUF497 family protein
VIFAWDAENVAHIARHDVEPEEAMFVVRRARPPFPEEREDGWYLVWGPTDSGRMLQVVYVFPEDAEIEAMSLRMEDLSEWSVGHELVVRIIHARDLTDREKRQFRRRRR